MNYLKNQLLYKTRMLHDDRTDVSKGIDVNKAYK